MFQDRIALSVYFMYNQSKHVQLQQFFDYIIEEECFKNADLHGVLLTGLNTKSIDLFQSFIEKFGDIQTVSLAIIHTPYADVLQSKQVQYWINCYCDLLNKFKLWEMRAEFDLFKMKLIRSQKIIQSVNLPIENSSDNVTSMLPNNNNSKNYLHAAYSSNQNFNRQNSTQSLNNLMQRPQYLRNQPNIHLACNKCGKNLLEKMPLTIDTNNANQAQYNRQTSQYFNSNVSLNHGVSANSLILNQKSLPFKTNDQNLNGCLNCARFLPQCIVCLKLMKINLTPSPFIVNQNQFGHHTLNRSQSLYATTPIPIYSNNSADKLTSKSPSIQISKNQTVSSTMPHSADMNFHFFSDLEDQQNDEAKQQQQVMQSQHQRSKPSIHPENFFFLNNSKFGNWFSWCQSCKHGGHISCLMNWFKFHEKCPFLHCKCQCLNIDNHIN